MDASEIGVAAMTYGIFMTIGGTLAFALMR
jgi:hypothetical protein